MKHIRNIPVIIVGGVNNSAPMKNKENRATTMTVRYKTNDVVKLKAKAEKEGLDVSTYVRHISLKSLNQ